MSNSIKEEKVIEDDLNKKRDGLFSNIRSKIKKIKHLDIILIVLFISIILLIYFSSFSSKEEGSLIKNNVGQDKIEQSIEAELFFSTEDYAIHLENKIKNTISQVKGAGNVCVVVGFLEEIQNNLAYTITTETKEDGTKVETKSPILVSNQNESQPIILSQKLPRPSNIVVIATGASNTNVKLEIVRVIQSMYDNSTIKIEVFAGN